MAPPANDLEGKEDIHVAEPFDYPSLKETLGGMWEALEEGAEKMGSALAEGVYTFLVSAEATAYTIGEWVGWGVAIIGFEFFLTKSASFIAGLFPKAAKLLLKIVQLSEKIDDIIGSLLSPLVRFAGMVDDMLGKMVAYMQHIKLPFVDEVLGAMVSMKAKLMAFFEELIEKMARHLDELTKSKKGKPGAPGKKPDPNAPGKPKDGADPKKKKPDGEEDENLRKEAELRAQRIWPTLDADTLQTRTDWNQDLAKKDSRPTASVRFTHEVDLDANRWQLMVTAKEGMRWGRATAGKGWRASVDADDAVHEREAWLGKVDKSAANKQVLQASAPDIEAAWNDAWWSDGDLDAAMKKAMAQEDGELDRASYDETDLFLDVGDLEMSILSGRLVASPNSQHVPIERKVEPLDSKEYKAAFERAAPAAFDKHMREPWALRIEQEIDGFEWSDVPDYDACRAEGFDRATKAINEWFQKKARRRSVPWDERLERELLTVEEHRGALFGPVLEAGAEHLKQLLAGQDDILETIEVDHAAAVLYVGQATGVAQILVDAVKESGSDNQAIVDFLLKLGRGGRTANGVSSKEFGDKGSVPHKASWYATDGGGYLANRKWVKDKFRKADDEKHEWIPSDMLEEMVDRDVSAEDATTTATWIEAQHQMRSPTEAILFWPDANTDVLEMWQDALDAGTTDGVAFIQEKEISTVTFDLQGHSGALYVKEGEKKVPQTKGQGEFHDHLRRLVRASETPRDYRTQLTDYLKDGGIWDGSIDFLPEEWDEPEHKAIRTTHEGKNNKPLGGNLFLVGKSVYSAFQAVLKVVEG